MVGSVPSCNIQFSDSNAIYLAAGNSPARGGFAGMKEAPGTKCTYLGLLSAQSECYRKFIEGILKQEGWDFSLFPSSSIDMVFIERK